jgi:hypothetical protein
MKSPKQESRTGLEEMKHEEPQTSRCFKKWSSSTFFRERIRRKRVMHLVLLDPETAIANFGWWR